MLTCPAALSPLRGYRCQSLPSDDEKIQHYVSKQFAPCQALPGVTVS